MQKPLLDDLMTITEAAKKLHKTEAALRQDIWRGLIPYRKINGRVYLLRYELEALIQKAPGRRLDQVVND